MLRKASGVLNPIKRQALILFSDFLSSKSRKALLYNGFRFQKSKIEKLNQRGKRFVNQAIDAIIEFNNVDSRPVIDKWRICRSALRALTGRGDSVTSRVIESRKDEIDAHNSQHELSERHNAKGKNYPSIDTVFLDQGMIFRSDN